MRNYCSSFAISLATDWSLYFSWSVIHVGNWQMCFCAHSADLPCSSRRCGWPGPGVTVLGMSESPRSGLFAAASIEPSSCLCLAGTSCLDHSFCWSPFWKDSLSKIEIGDFGGLSDCCFGFHGSGSIGQAWTSGRSWRDCLGSWSSLSCLCCNDCFLSSPCILGWGQTISWYLGIDSPSCCDPSDASA